MKNIHLAAMIFAISALQNAVWAQTQPKSGKFDYTACWTVSTNVMNPIDKVVATSYEMTGITRSAIPGDLFDNNTFHCIGLSTNFNGKQTNQNTCVSVDKDGDKRVGTFTVLEDGTTKRAQVAGTGKFDGMSQTTEATPYAAGHVVKPGTIQQCNRQTGTYTLK